MWEEAFAVSELDAQGQTALQIQTF